MKIEIDDDIILPIFAGILAIFITISTFFISKSYHEKTIEELVRDSEIAFQETAMANREIDSLTKEVQVFRTTENSIMKLGANMQQAIWVMEAANEYKISWKVLASLIYSESEFKECHHANPNWIGLAGINAPVWKDECPYSPYTDKGNIFSAAWILKVYLDESNGDYLKALTHYKGFSPMGKKYAQHVLDIRYKNFK